MKLIVITGNIASGKSTAVLYLREKGEVVVCADEAIHALLQLPDIQSELQKHFELDGDPDLSNVKDQIRRHLFSSKNFQKWYLPWIHGKVSEKIQSDLIQLKAKKLKRVFLDIPLFYESAHHWLKPQQVWLVWTPKSIRIERWSRRKHASLAEMEKIQDWQIPDEEKLQKADIILSNVLGISELHQQVEQALKQA
jgi:dephospho-CoA kinase